jgi:hypothetical protein
MPANRALLTSWGLDDAIARDQMHRAPTARERQPWHAIWLVSHGWSRAQVARALGATRTRSATGCSPSAPSVPPGSPSSRTAAPPP